MIGRMQTLQRTVIGVAVAFAVSVTGCSKDHSTVSSASTTTTSSTSTSTTTSAPVSTTVAPISATTPLGPRGLGPIVAGMTVREALAASGVAITPQRENAASDMCLYATLAGEPDLRIIVYTKSATSDLQDATVESFTISTTAGSAVAPSSRKTVAGIGLGATEAQVRAAYPTGLDTEPHQYVTGGSYLYVQPTTDPGFGIRYVLDQHRVVVSIDVGHTEAIHLVEGCS